MFCRACSSPRFCAPLGRTAPRSASRVPICASPVRRSSTRTQAILGNLPHVVKRTWLFMAELGVCAPQSAFRLWCRRRGGLAARSRRSGPTASLLNPGAPHGPTSAGAPSGSALWPRRFVANSACGRWCCGAWRGGPRAGRRDLIGRRGRDVAADDHHGRVRIARHARIAVSGDAGTAASRRCRERAHRRAVRSHARVAQRVVVAADVVVVAHGHVRAPLSASVPSQGTEPCIESIGVDEVMQAVRRRVADV